MIHCWSQRTVQIASLLMKAPTGRKSSADSMRSGVPSWLYHVVGMLDRPWMFAVVERIVRWCVCDYDGK
jgi:hypothetical protein